MSYSFSVTEKSKAEAIASIVAQLAKVVELQPVHAADYEQAIACAQQIVAVLRDDANMLVHVSMNGSISVGAAGVSQVNVSVNATLTTPAPGE